MAANGEHLQQAMSPADGTGGVSSPASQPSGQGGGDG